MGFKRRTKGPRSLQVEFDERWEYLLETLEDEEIVEFLLCELPREKDPALPYDDPDRHFVEWAWGWFCGAADALGKTRRQLYEELTD